MPRRCFGFPRLRVTRFPPGVAGVGVRASHPDPPSNNKRGRMAPLLFGGEGIAPAVVIGLSPVGARLMMVPYGGRDYSPASRAHPSRGPLGDCVACAFAPPLTRLCVEPIAPASCWQHRPSIGAQLMMVTLTRTAADSRASHPDPPSNNKRGRMAPLLFGGEGGIRTPGRVLPVNGFQDRRIRPLCHLSAL